MLYQRHSLSQHPLYRVWQDMKTRCYNSNHKGYKDYGKRGIKICNEWINDPEIFIKWALANGWEKGLLIDRENNNGNYTPNNVRFVNRELNQRNQRLLRSNNTSGYRGVSWNKREKNWVAKISINNKHKYLGFFSRPKLAALRYDVEAILLNDGRPLNFE